MKLEKNNKNFYINYCTNIHPGETWEEIFFNVKTYTKNIYQEFKSEFKSIGLRLSASAANELWNERAKLDELKNWLKENKFSINTINGFPFGNFHGEKIKENVYLPDWFDARRIEYTITIAKIMSYLGEPGEVSSISTVPVGLKSKFENDISKLNAAIQNLMQVAKTLQELEAEFGHKVVLALEPEPSCFLENTSDILHFFGSIKSKIFQEYIGICYDCCHLAVMYEDDTEYLDKLIENNISIFKVQVSSGLRFFGDSTNFKRQIKPFEDGVYLHQFGLRDADGKIQQFLDLDSVPNHSDEREYRVHFHVPVFQESFGTFRGTSSTLGATLKKLANHCNSFEVETYTFEVLPQKFKTNSIEENIRKELLWTLTKLNIQ